jgi:hypothetical protein
VTGEQLVALAHELDQLQLEADGAVFGRGVAVTPLGQFVVHFDQILSEVGEHGGTPVAREGSDVESISTHHHFPWPPDPQTWPR